MFIHAPKSGIFSRPKDNDGAVILVILDCSKIFRIISKFKEKSERERVYERIGRFSSQSAIMRQSSGG